MSNGGSVSQRYGVATLASVMALVLTLLLQTWAAQTPFLFFFAAIAVSGWYGGFRPGLLATAIAVLASRFLFRGPVTWEEVLRLGALAAVGLLISSLLHAARQAEREARQQRERLHVTLSSIGDAVIVTNIHGDVTFMNPVAESLTGWRLLEAIGRPLNTVFRIVSEKTKATFEDPVQRVLREGAVVGLAKSTLLTARDGSERPIDDSSAPIRGAGGQTIGVVLVFRDISERRKAEEELRASEQRTLMAMEAAHMGYWEWNIASGQAKWSQNLEPILGLAPGTFGGTIDAFLQIVHPQDREAVARAIQGAVDQRSSYEVEFRTPWPDGGVRWILGKGRVFSDETGKAARMVGLGLDITGRKQAEEGLRETEARFRMLADAAPVLIWMSGPDKGRTYFNKGWLEFTGRTVEQESGKGWAEGVHPDDLHLCITKYETAFDGRESFRIEYRLRRFDGEYRWVLDTGVPRSKPRAGFVGYIGSCLDITERKRAEEERLRRLEREQALRAEAEAAAVLHRGVERRLTALVEASGLLLGSLKTSEVWPSILELSERLITADACAIWRTDRSTGHWQMVAVRGLSEDQAAELGNLPQTPPLPDAPLLFEDVEQSPPLAMRQEVCRQEGIRSILVVPLKTHGATAGTITFYYRQQRHFSDIEVRVTTALANLSGSAIGSAELYEEQTHRQREAQAAEQRAAFLADAGVALASSLDYQTTLATVAELAVPRFADWCAVDVVEDNRGLRRVAMVHSDPAKLELARELQAKYAPEPSSPYGVLNVLRTGQPEFLYEIDDESLVKNASDPAYLRVLRGLGLHSYVCVPLVARARTLGVITFATAASDHRYGPEDVAFAKELAARAALAVDNARLFREANAANRMKDEFLATVSHELRTPLTAMLGWARMLRGGGLDAKETRRALETIERNAKAQAQLVDDMLDVSGIVTGKLRLNVRLVELPSVIEAAVDAVRPAVDSKGIQLQMVLDPRAGPVSGDPDRLQQVVWNLLSNAVKFTSKGGRVQVRLERINSHVEIAVSDTGQGIRPEFLAYVFERFRQADSSSTRSFGGLGLGLAIVRHLVELHGGSVRADSPGEGQGATFTVRLPLMPISYAERPLGRSADRAHPTAEQDAKVESSAADLKGLQVMVVDDEADTRQLLIAVLGHYGAEVVACASSAEALEALDRTAPHVLLSDLEMPGEDGYSLIRKIRSREDPRGRRIPAAALTAYARLEDRVRALSAGFQMHLPKPVEPAELVVVVANLAKMA